MAALAARSSLGKTIGPVVRAGLTSATLMALSDVACQTVQQRLRASDERQAQLDLQRTARFSLIGLSLHGPLFFLGFRAIDQRFGPAATLSQAFRKAMAGHLTLFPTYTVGFFMAMGLLEGRGWEGAAQKLKDNFGTTMVSGSVFWPLVNIVNFRYIPPTGRLVYVNMCGMAWHTWLSFVSSQPQSSAASPHAAAALEQPRSLLLHGATLGTSAPQQ